MPLLRSAGQARHSHEGGFATPTPHLGNQVAAALECRFPRCQWCPISLGAVDDMGGGAYWLRRRGMMGS